VSERAREKEQADKRRTIQPASLRNSLESDHLANSAPFCICLTQGTGQVFGKLPAGAKERKREQADRERTRKLATESARANEREDKERWGVGG
jgi:hypothetical protein